MQGAGGAEGDGVDEAGKGKEGPYEAVSQDDPVVALDECPPGDGTALSTTPPADIHQATLRRGRSRKWTRTGG